MHNDKLIKHEHKQKLSKLFCFTVSDGKMATSGHKKGLSAW